MMSKIKMKMNANVKNYLLQYLAPALSQKFNINLVDVENVINTFDGPLLTPPSELKRKPPVEWRPKKREPTKDDLVKEARDLKLKVTTKMKKGEIQAMLDTAKNMIHPSQAKKAEDREVGSLEGKSFTSKTLRDWTFGKLLKTGGFGAVYEVEGNPNLVIKTGNDYLEKGKDSGLFLEKAVYAKLRDPEGDKYGIPQMVDSGKLPINIKTNDYYIVMPRFEITLDDIGTLTPQDKKKVINDVLDALNHLSKKGYLHLDIKAGNIMKKNDRWFLIDYGMAERFDQNTETTPNPKKAGNGTTWFMARDAHKGLMSRKADLESLVYLLVAMEGDKLPGYRTNIRGEKDKDYLQYVLEKKQEFFDTYKNLNLPQYYNKFIEYVDKLQPGTEPKYQSIKI